LEYHYFPAKTGMDDTGSQTNMNDKPRFSALIALSALMLGFSCVSVQADNSQQQKMKTCNADATSKKLTGDDRKAYMKTCLSGSSSSTAPAGTAPAGAAPSTK
jgi:hypothetical protein